ncbi:MAG: OmpA family protein [Pseudomonadales bacterium]
MIDANDATPTAVNDSGSGTAGVAGTYDILANDDFLPNNDSNNVGTTAIVNLGTGTAAGTISFNNSTGELTYTPTFGEGGSAPTVVYQVCNIVPNPDVCATATAIITVAAASDTDGDGNPDATDPNVNAPTAAADSGNADPAVAATFSVLANDDFLANNDAANAGTTTLVDTGNGTAGGVVAADPATGGITYTPLAGEAGQAVTVEYQVCNTDPNPDVCATAVLTVNVSTGPDTDGDGNPDATDPNVNTPTAAADNGGASVNVAASFDVLANDDFLPNNAPNNAGTTTVVDTGNGIAGGTVVLDAATGQITYTPLAGEAGSSVTVEYEVCNTDPNPDVCATALLTVNVAAGPDTDMDGNPDATDPNVSVATAQNDSGNGSVGLTGNYDLLANDDFLPNNAANNAGVTTLVDLGTGSAAGVAVMNATTGQLDYTPVQAEASTSVTVNYEVCNTSPDPDVCAQATATIAIAAAAGPDTDNDGTPDVIDANPATPTAVDDSFSGTVDVAATHDILANDDFLPNNNGNGVGTVSLADNCGGTAAGSIAFDAAAGTLIYTPTIAESGVAVTVEYQVCNTGPDPDVCDIAVVTINVAALPDTDMDGIPDTVEGTADSDGDGLPDFNDPDADNDGIPDAVEAGALPSMPVDTDGDGLPDYLDLDSDGDRIIDRIEAGAAPTVPTDTDGDGKPDYIDTDSDNDNIPDTLEDSNSPILSGADIDSDGIDDAVDVSETGGMDGNGNGIDDAFEPTNTDGDGRPGGDNLPNHLDLDSDADRLLDIIESVTVPAPVPNDADSDGIDDSLDVDITGGDDLNNNGIDDSLEPLDTDADGKPDYLDIDADNDSIPDAVEAAPNGATLPVLSGLDSDSDGIDDAVDPDNGGAADGDLNGISDNGEPVNTDIDLNAANGDVLPDYRDLDSDNDSLLDLEEAGNGAAVPEVNDVNMDGLVDTPADEASVPTPADSDSDGIPDYRDLESTNPANNGAGPYDLSTNPTPPADNGAGMVDDPADMDGDGIADSTDPQPNAFGGGTDSDLDGIPNDMDLDDDNDGIPDLVEGFNASNPAASVDTDADGVPDYLDLDSDNDGLTDLIESSPTADDIDNNGRIDTPVDIDLDGVDDTRAVNTPVDTDSDGTPDFRDLDSDNDGLADLAESLPPGVAASTIDVNGDGVQDAIDPQSGRPLNPLVPQDNDMDGDSDFRIAAGFTLNNLPGGEGPGLRTSVSGGGGSAGLLLIVLAVPLLLRRSVQFCLRNAARICMRNAARICMRDAAQHLHVMLGIAVFASFGVVNSQDAFAEDNDQTLCGYHFDDNRQRLGSKQASDRDRSSFGRCWYGGVGLNYAHLHPEGRDGNGWATDDGEDRDFGWEVLIGKRLNEHWFAELKYADQGEAGLESSTIPALNAAYPDASIVYRTSSLMLGRYLRDSDEELNWYAKIGVASIHNDADNDNNTVLFNEVTTEQLAFGLGAEYRFGQSRWFARINADFYDQDSLQAGIAINRYIGGTREGAITPAVTSPAPTAVTPDDTIVQPRVITSPELAREVLQQRREQQRRADCANFDSIVEGINFETDSARLTGESQFKLIAYARSLAQYPGTIVQVGAHTDWIGSGAYNQSLSERRATSVVEFLVQSGVEKRQLRSVGYGETRPIADNNTRDGRARNRRVELSIIESPECGR